MSESNNKRAAELLMKLVIECKNCGVSRTDFFKQLSNSNITNNTTPRHRYLQQRHIFSGYCNTLMYIDVHSSELFGFKAPPPDTVYYSASRMSKKTAIPERDYLSLLSKSREFEQQYPELFVAMKDVSRIQQFLPRQDIEIVDFQPCIITRSHSKTLRKNVTQEIQEIIVSDDSEAEFEIIQTMTAVSLKKIKDGRVEKKRFKKSTLDAERLHHYVAIEKHDVPEHVIHISQYSSVPTTLVSTLPPTKSMMFDYTIPLYCYKVESSFSLIRTRLYELNNLIYNNSFYFCTPIVNLVDVMKQAPNTLYRRLSLRIHPDKTDNPKHHELFRQMTTAFKVLSLINESQYGEYFEASRMFEIGNESKAMRMIHNLISSKL